MHLFHKSFVHHLDIQFEKIYFYLLNNFIFLIVQIYEFKSNKILQNKEKICIIGGEKLSIQLLELKNDLVFQKIFGTQKNSLIIMVKIVILNFKLLHMHIWQKGC